MNLDIQQLLMLIGGKEVDLLLCRQALSKAEAEIADLRKRLSEAEEKLGQAAK